MNDFLDRGDQLGSLLALRGQSKAAAESARQAASLRTGTIGLLGRLRNSIQDEVAGGAKLPAGYEAKLFATFDELSKRREAAAHRRAAGEKADGVEAPVETAAGEAAAMTELTSETPAGTTPAK